MDYLGKENGCFFFSFLSPLFGRSWAMVFWMELGGLFFSLWIAFFHGSDDLIYLIQMQKHSIYLISLNRMLLCPSTVPPV